MKDFKVLIVNESTGSSIVRDFFTFGCLLGSFLFNYRYLGNSIVVQILISICFFIFAAKGKSPTLKRMTKEEALKYLQGCKEKKNAEV